MSIEFQCPRCQTQLNVPDEEAGKKQRCPGCKAKLRVPAPAVAPAAGALIEFLCPRCHVSLSVPSADAGKKQLCPSCHGKLRVPAPEGGPPAGAAIEFQCPRCHVPLSVPATDAGKKQHCPNCRGKLRVPTPEAAPSLAAAIEFQCPRCQVPLTIPAADAGKKHRCPGCGAKLRVPAPAESDVQAPAASSSTPVDEFPDWGSDDDDDSGEYLVGERVHHTNILGFLIPLACVAILAGVAAWLLYKPEPKLEGTLAGERVADVEFGPMLVDNRYLGKPKRAARDAFNSLETAPLRAISQLLVLEFASSPAAINVSIRATDGCEFYRVDPRSDRRLAKYIDKEKERMTAALEQELKQSVPEFLKVIEKRPEGARDVPGLAEFRNSVGLTSLVQGFGFHVQAVIDKQVYPCVHEDDEGRLYFSFPVNTQEFELVGRGDAGKPSKENPPFPGHYKVSISGKPVTVHKKVLDPKEKVRELLKQ